MKVENIKIDIVTENPRSRTVGDINILRSYK
jgi:hypothetical protein